MARTKSDSVRAWQNQRLALLAQLAESEELVRETSRRIDNIRLQIAQLNGAIEAVGMEFSEPVPLPKTEKKPELKEVKKDGEA